MKETTDVWFIAFLMHKGVSIKSYSVISRGKVQCKFDLDDSTWQSYKLEFNNSEIVKFKGLIEQIKDLGY
jgi:hypothetical protein